MGCDIHIKVQQKVDDKWEDLYLDVKYDGRDYELFAFLHDVRNIRFDIKPYSVTNDRNGLPDDMVGQEPYIGGYEFCELHNVFWASLEELTDITAYTQQLNCYGEIKSIKDEICSSWFEYLEELKKLNKEIRLIIGFDN